MKTTALSRKLFYFVLAMLIVCGLFERSAQAGYIVTLDQVGSNVVANGSGPIDLTGLTAGAGFAGASFIVPKFGGILTGSTSNADIYGGSGVITGPSSFGSGAASTANSGTGDLVGFENNSGSFGNFIIVPTGYVSGNALSDSATYNGATFASLGVTPGIYEWTWGTGINQNFTLQIGAAAGVPDTGTTATLFGFSLAGLAFLRGKLA